MRLLNNIRSNLNVKLFLSFLIVIVVGTIMLVAAVEVAAIGTTLHAVVAHDEHQ